MKIMSILYRNGGFCKNANITSFCEFIKRNIYVLGIESSCDDTSAAVVDDSGNVIGEGHFSQGAIHARAGGIIPSLACNLHRQNLKSVVDASLKQSLLSIDDINAIAVTVKPGLIMSLSAGVDYAKNLCKLYSKPLIPIHHMEAHALTGRMVQDVKFPFLVFLISGGHCILALAESVDKFYTLGKTLDDSPGKILDFIARRTRLKNSKKFNGLVGGAAVEFAALGGDSGKFQFPVHIQVGEGKSCNFSFSGIATCGNIHIMKQETDQNLEPDEIIPNINDFCAAVLLSVANHMCQKLEVAFRYIQKKNLLQENEKHLVVSGGVASNKFLRKAIKRACDMYGYKMTVPPPKLCTDNGVMIAWNGIERLKENLPVIQPDDLSSVVPEASCPLGEDISHDVHQLFREIKFKYMKLNSYSEIASGEEV